MVEYFAGNLIDLFAGAGGFSLGAHLAGFRTAVAIDFDEDLSSSFTVNFPRTKLVKGDLSKLEPAEIAKLAGLKKDRITGIIGGPPCQGFSYIGKRDPNDPRSTLVGRFYEIVREIAPPFFVMENVPGLISEEFLPVLDAGLELVADKYCILPTLTLDASDFGAATSRERVFVVGYRKEYVDEITYAEIDAKKVLIRATVFDAIGDLPSLASARKDKRGDFWGTLGSESEEEYQKTARKSPPPLLSRQTIRTKLHQNKVSGFQPTNHSDAVAARFATVAEGGYDRVSRASRLAWNDQCPSLRAGTGKDHGSYQALRPIHPTQNRVISVREAARLQGFPDWFQFHPTIWHSFRMIGNSVSPYVAKEILSVIVSKLGDKVSD